MTPEFLQTQYQKIEHFQGTVIL